ncbi:MAG: GumC family protein [Desulfobulbaceae bacterium]|nr:GumC family protein [Desulfobulbaceae bacterium]
MALTGINSTRDFFRIWFFWKKQALFVFFLIVGVVMIYSYTCTPEYESTARILLLPKTSEGEVISSGTDEKRIVPISDKDLFTEMELLISDAVLKNTVRSFGEKGEMDLHALDKAWYYGIFSATRKVVRGVFSTIGLAQKGLSPFDANVKFLRNSLIIEPVTDSNIILVSLMAERPDGAVVVLNRLLKSYERHRNKVFTKEGGLKFYDSQTSLYGQKLAEEERNLKEFQKDWNIVNLDVQNTANIQLLAELNKELHLLNAIYDENQTRISLLKKSLTKNNGKDVIITKEMRDIPAIVELEKGIVPLLIKRSEISRSFTETSREYTDISGQIEILRSETRREVERALATDELELESLGMKRESLEYRIAQLLNQSSEFNQKEKILEELKRQIELHRNNYMLYAAKTEDAKIYSARTKNDIANISIADQATVSPNPVFPDRLLMLVMSIIFGGFAAGCAPFVLESMDSKLKTPDDVQELLALPVICSFREVED